MLLFSRLASRMTRLGVVPASLFQFWFEEATSGNGDYFQLADLRGLSTRAVLTPAHVSAACGVLV